MWSTPTSEQKAIWNLKSKYFFCRDPNDPYSLSVAKVSTFAGIAQVRRFSGIVAEKKSVKIVATVISNVDADSSGNENESAIQNENVFVSATQNETESANQNGAESAIENENESAIQNGNEFAVQNENESRNQVGEEAYYAVDYFSRFYIGRTLQKVKRNVWDMIFFHQPNFEGRPVFKCPAMDDQYIVYQSAIFYGPVGLMVVHEFTTPQLQDIIAAFEKKKQ